MWTLSRLWASFFVASSNDTRPTLYPESEVPLTCTRCHRCDSSLLGDHERWLISVNVTADFEPDLAHAPDDPAIAIPRLISALEGDEEGADEAEADVHSEMAFVLCARCRHQWMDNPLGVVGRRDGQPIYLLH